jgi:hypothetical protein
MNIEFLKVLKSPKEGVYGRKEKNRGDQSIQVMVHIYMEVYCCHKQKCLFFKNIEQKGKTSPDWGLVTVGWGEYGRMIYGQI